MGRESKRIFFLLETSKGAGGVERVTETLATEFEKNHCDVELLSLYTSNSSEFDVNHKKIKHMNLEPLITSASKFKKILTLITNGIKLHRQTKFNCFDYLIVQGFYAAIYLPFLPASSELIVCEHNAYNAPGRLSRIARVLLYKIYNPTLVCLCESDVKYYKSLKVQKLFKVYNPSPFRVLRREISSAGPLISLGRFVNQKQFSKMIILMDAIRVKFQGIRLKIQGQGEELELMNQLVEDFKLRDVVEILPQGDPQALYAEGSIFLMTSIYEGLPMTLIEALHFGLPIVAFNCSGGIGEIVIDGYNGYLVPMGQDELFVERVVSLLSDQATMRKYSENSYEHSKKFEKNMIVDQWMGILK